MVYAKIDSDPDTLCDACMHYRLWECIYLDVIPIVLKSDSVNIGNLPIIYLDKWSDLDTTNLNVVNDDGILDFIRFKKEAE